MKARDVMLRVLYDSRHPSYNRAESLKDVDSILSALESAGFAVVPVEPTEEMADAAWCCGCIGDNGGGERADFEKEWKSVLQFLKTGEPIKGLITLR